MFWKYMISQCLKANFTVAVEVPVYLPVLL